MKTRFYKTAIIIPNYNMPERTDALVEYIQAHAKAPHDIFVVDNGSDLVEPSKYTNVFIEKNCQTTCGWLKGLTASDTVAEHNGYSYFAYMIMITSTEFVKESGDPLTPLVEFLAKTPQAAVIHAALTRDSTSALDTRMMDRGSGKPRRIYLVDNIAALWRANWLNSIGRFRKELTMGWGVLPETCWKARRDRKTIWIHEGTLIKKVSNIGYTMNRMNMTASERSQLASAEAHRILEPIYGDGFYEKLVYEWVKRGADDIKPERSRVEVMRQLIDDEPEMSVRIRRIKGLM